MKILESLTDGEFLGLSDLSGCDGLPPPACDAGPLPPGCDCICHTPCDFGKSESNYSSPKDSNYDSGIMKGEVYEME